MVDEQSLFRQALELDTPERRAKWLDDVCGRATPLRQRIDALLDKHEQANSFLERPFVETDGSRARGADDEPITEDRPVEPAPSFEPDGPVVIGNHSVLKSLGKTTGELPRVVLREPNEEGVDPVVKPASPEIPSRDADSRYQLLGEIAQGGMGAVIKGRDTDLGRDLAIKVLLETHRDKPEIVQRFVEEAQIGGQLQHPGIAPLYELGQFSDRRPFFSMKLVKGQTLSALLAERSDPSQDRAKFLGIFEQVCQTMAYAHSRGVIHRDLKPANVMVGAFGEVHVMDWGLAKVLRAGGVADERNEQKTSHKESIIQTLRSLGSDTPAGLGSQTQIGSVMGTPAYMAPEQALGEVDRLDERSDVFGLGAILCVILTGEPPYVGKDGTQVFRHAMQGKLKDCFSRLDACGADKELVDLAKHCVEVEPDDRPRDAGVLAERVSQHLESVENRLREAEVERAAQTARADEERKRRRVTMALAASVLLTIGVVGAGWIHLEKQNSLQGLQRVQRQAAAEHLVNNSLHDADVNERSANAVDVESELDREDALYRKLRELDKAVVSAAQAVESARQDDVAQELRLRADQRLSELRIRQKAIAAEATRATAERTFQEELEQIRLAQANQGTTATRLGYFFDVRSADQRYEQAFREAGFDVLALNVPDAVALIQSSSMRDKIIAALDHWARSISEPTSTEDESVRFSDVPAATPMPARRETLLSVADGADDNPWRKSIRGALRDNDVMALKELAAGGEVKRQSPELIAWLGDALWEAGELDMSVAVLRESQRENPGDFWLNYALAVSLRKIGEAAEAVEFARAALAIRPESLEALIVLSAAFAGAGRTNDAIQAQHAVLPRMPLEFENAEALWYRGLALIPEDKKDDYIALRREYCEAYPNDARGHLHLAMALDQYGDGDPQNEILDELQKVADLKPKDARTYAWIPYGVAVDFESQGRMDEAAVAFRIGAEFAPVDVWATDSLDTLVAAGNWAAAVEFGRGWMQHTLDVPDSWLRLAPLLILSGDEEAYREHCRRMVKQFAGTNDFHVVETVCKACCLMPGAIDVARLPIDELAQSLDQPGATPDWFPQWGWSARALAAYRSGDAETALKYLEKVQHNSPDPHAHALILVVRALAQISLGPVDEARIAIENASRAVTALPGYKDSAHHDVLIPAILLQEAKAKIGASVSQGE